MNQKETNVARERIPTFNEMDEMVDSAVLRIIRAFGKGEDLRGACWSIVNSSVNWKVKWTSTHVEGDERG